MAAARVLPSDEAAELFRILDGRSTLRAREELDLHPRNLAFPLRMRNDPADAISVLGTCVRSEYAPLLPKAPPEFVVDAGAYIGDFTALLLSTFPEAKLVALEPQPDAYSLAEENAARYGTRATALNVAAWNVDGIVGLEGHGVTARVGSTVAAAGTMAMSLATVVERAAFPRIDLLKCDIEGAESVVFGAGSQRWLSFTRQVLVELHGPEAASIVARACEAAGLAYVGRYRNTHSFARPHR